MEEQKLGYAWLSLQSIKKTMEEIAGEWNGDNAGIQEDRAHIAVEILAHIESIEKLQEELNGTN